MQALAEGVENQFLRTLRVVPSLPASGATNQLLVSSLDWRTYRWTGSAWVPLNPGMPACVLYNDTARGITTGTPQTVPMTGSEQNDSVGGNPMWSLAGDPYSIVIRENGLYDIGVRGQWSADTTGYRVLGITKNKASGGFAYANTVAFNLMPSSTNAPEGNGQEATNRRRFVVGDVLRVNAGQTSGATRWLEGGTTGNNGGGLTTFWAIKIRD
ncbi:hypothetical protein [Amycolatopsis viridis]|uniref:Minor tail protein n=1 Tax=Amycolatopsis viridis TaxID=185678 RepID=A0ABX0T0H1_9PSEU|nr:hypothetical protein [Amycolatopsis viridis]NIH81682.1 hypothetical protein [Amycolatopsis viridis]